MAVNTATPDQTFLEKLMFAIEEQYEKESKEVVDRHKKQIESELETLRNDIVHRASLEIKHRTRIDDFGDQITITIIKD